MAPYSPVTGGDSAVRGGVRFRIRPLQAIVAFGVLCILCIPLLAGSDRRAAVGQYLTAPHHNSHNGALYPVQPATGGLDPRVVPLSLEKRLQLFIEKPALDAWEAELPNRYNCPMWTYHRNNYFFHGGKEKIWQDLTKADIRKARQKMVDYLRTLDAQGEKIVWDKSLEANTPRDQRRGLIFAGGGGKTLDRIRVALDLLRNVHKSKLPVEIYHFDDELQDQTVRKELMETWAPLELVESTAHVQGSEKWKIKNRAFIDTKFTQFLYFDSDCLPLMNPIELFDSQEFKQSGSVFWPDINKDHPDNSMWRFLGRECSDMHWPAETGQMLYDKSANNGLNLAALHLSMHMMEEKQFYGVMAYGDKDTFRYAFYILGLPYQQPPRLFSVVGGYEHENNQGKYNAHSLMHHGLHPVSERNNPNFIPKPAFLHQILMKHRKGFDPKRVFSHTKRPRLDAIDEPRLVRTPIEFAHGSFVVTLKGPDGMPGGENSVGDGQGEVLVETKDVVPIWDELEKRLPAIVGIS